MKIISRVLLLIFLYHKSILSTAHAMPGMPPAIIVPAAITIAEFYEQYTAVGQIRFQQSRDYFAKVAGRIDFIAKGEGGKFVKDEIILMIDQSIAEAAKAQAQAALEAAKATYERDLSLLKKKITSEETLSKSRVAYEQARSDHVKAINTYQDMVIRAPGDGYVGVVQGNVGDEIKTDDYMFSFIKDSDFVALVELPEYLRGKILTSDIVHIKPADEQLINGTIVAISDYVSNNGTIVARLKFPGQKNLIHNSFVETVFVFNKHKALALPEKSVLKNNEGNFVYQLLPDNKVKQMFVTLGVRTGEMIELLSNELKEGDQIVLEGLTKIHDGASVTLGK